jgi:hypothetical protein
MLLLPKIPLPINHPFEDNKYTRWYYAIIDRGRKRQYDKSEYTERHHIIPESFYINRKRAGVRGWLSGNPDDRENIIRLTAEEHFIAHWLLTKMVAHRSPAWFKMENALARFMQSSQNHKRILTAGQYARIRKAIISAKTGIPSPYKGIPRAPETIELIKRNRKGKGLGIPNPNKGIPATQEARDKVSKANKGKRVGVDNPFFNKTHTDEVKKLIAQNTSRAQKGRTKPKLPCPHCGSLRSAHTMGRHIAACTRIEEPKEQIPIVVWNKGMKMWNDGKRNKFSYESPGHGWKLGRI